MQQICISYLACLKAAKWHGNSTVDLSIQIEHLRYGAVADESKEICFAIQPGCQQVEISDIYVGSYFSISKYPAAKVVLTVW